MKIQGIETNNTAYSFYFTVIIKFSLPRTIFHFFLIVEMVFHPLYLLIVFMPFARNQNDIARLGKLRSRANRFPAIDDSESFTTLFGIEALNISFNISFGFSNRGLSDVNITRSLKFTASRAIMGRFAIPVSTGSTTVMICPLFPKTSRMELNTLFKASGYEHNPR